MNKLFQILGAVTLLSMLSACSDFRKAIGTEKSSPDEFQVVVRPSLVLPPNFSSRPTAATGAQTAATVASDAQAQASVLLGARETGASDYSDIFAFDKIVEDVRSKVDEETAGIKFERRLPIQVLFGGLPDVGPVIDKMAEDRRIRRNRLENRSLSYGATPAIDKVFQDSVLVE
ncbi:MAG: DUF3035 domain-containing protein [Alphaproteobacteria bacterium]|jgi:hypothetical protein|nr:hypothetical protein [SAR116 cluster bacterium]MBT4848208.1 DUF3035 domain-containing protein [Alphaproteobacteria bacterium]MBT5729633.1 DUF3035 domain-containing protein [Alphaproteobacteria bacterium]MBT7219741.1 DUF3035 domain-containing protein [Alphaproteobacteria bacterium]MDA8881990.1 DUF3035 domain-containing protein [Alphaproteobacteria bacterium]|tara:strand:+ start:162 stop:683 length:522 start_codon:yes stop_codon:yes gene_type:complete